MSDLAMASKAYWGYPREFMESCREELTVSDGDIANPGVTHVVAETGNRIVGFYALERISGSLFELEALFVDPSHIGTGIGRALVEHAKGEAVRHGAGRLEIQGDPHAEKFYLAAGAEKTGERESASIPGRYLPMFEIDLNAIRANTGAD